MPIVLGSERSPYGDTPNPKCFGTVSPLDPQLFSTIVEYAGDLLAGRRMRNIRRSRSRNGWKISRQLPQRPCTARAGTSQDSPEFRRVEEDVLIMNGLGDYFAGKLRSAVFTRSSADGKCRGRKVAVAQYRKAREAWAAMASRANSVYRARHDLRRFPCAEGTGATGFPPSIRISRPCKQVANSARTAVRADVDGAIRAATGRPNRLSVPCTHTPPSSFHPGQPLR